MGEIARWNGHIFEVSAGLIRGFSGLTIKGSSETEDKSSNNQKYVSRKNGKPREVSFDVILRAQLGCDVRTEALKFVDEATAGAKDYCYIGNKKLLPCSLMLTEASISDIDLIGTGTWTRAQVKCTFKQCSKNDSSSSRSSGSSGSSGSKKTSTAVPFWTKVGDMVEHLFNDIKTVATDALTGKTSTKTQTQIDTENGQAQIDKLKKNANIASAKTKLLPIKDKLIGGKLATLR